MTKTIAPYIEEFEKLKGTARKEPSWLSSLRQEALDSFAQKGFPAVKDEAWWCTDLGALAKKRFSVKSAPSQLTLKEIESFKKGLDGHFLFFFNGSYQPEISGVPKGIRVRDLISAMTEEPKLRQCFQNLLLSKENIFSDMNLALGVSGILIEISEDLKVDRPVFLIHWVDSSGALCQPKTFVTAGKGAKAILVEDYRGASGKKYLTNAFTGMILEEKAVLTHYKMQQESPGAFHIGNLRVKQEKGSSFSSLSASVGAKLTRQEISAELAEEASCSLSGISLGENDQHFDQVTWIDHAKPAGKSEQLFKGILGGESRGVFTGRVLVRQDAQKTEAHQTNKNLLLSPGAKADSRPQLEILADDVKCSHGAACGQLEEDAVFYLRARGMDERTAQKILAEGFAREITEVIGDPGWKSYTEKRVGEKLIKIGIGAT